MSDSQKENTSELLERIQALEAQLEASNNENLALQHELDKSHKSTTLHTRIDPLTQLMNRRTIFDKLEDEMARAERFDNLLTILLLDIDNFSEINEKYGQDYGDEVLKILAEVLKQATRAFDSVGRYGGEEFLVIFPETDLEAAAAVAERIRQRVEATLFTYGTHVTISGGLKTYYSEDIVKLVREADTALDEAKAKGKNKIVVSKK